jgi:hypothetical protein
MNVISIRYHPSNRQVDIGTYIQYVGLCIAVYSRLSSILCVCVCVFVCVILLSTHQNQNQLLFFGRAEDWDLSKPLQTCSLLVERGGDTLIFSFMAPPESNTVFAQAVIDISSAAPGTGGQPMTMQHWLEQVADSSRYYVLKIQSAEGGREATIGFGFRDREQGTDLRECLQHYEKSIRREKQAAAATAATATSTSSTGGTSTFSVPVLKEGEIIHVDRTSGKTSITKKKAARSGVPMLLKKPPPPSSEAGEKAVVAVAVAPVAATVPKVAAAAATEPSKEDVKEMTTEMGDIELNAEKDDGAAEDKDEVQWATDFDAK